MKKESVANLLTGALVVCALLVAAAVVWREFLPPAGGTSGPPEPRRIEQWQGLADAGRVIGSPEGKIRIVEFSDYQCPFCKTMHSTLGELQRRYPDRISVVYRHFPLPNHPHAAAAAAASECAAVQDRFAAFTQVLFDRQDSIGVTSWESLALAAGVPDTATFRRCRDEQWVKDRIDEDVAAGTLIGVNGTPTLVVRDEMVTAALSIEDLEKWLRRSEPGVFPE